MTNTKNGWTKNGWPPPPPVFDSMPDFSGPTGFTGATGPTGENFIINVVDFIQTFLNINNKSLDAVRKNESNKKLEQIKNKK
jgi:hypothetical protein